MGISLRLVTTSFLWGGALGFSIGLTPLFIRTKGLRHSDLIIHGDDMASSPHDTQSQMAIHFLNNYDLAVSL
jgi:hypothetical protein